MPVNLFCQQHFLLYFTFCRLFSYDNFSTHSFWLCSDNIHKKASHTKSTMLHQRHDKIWSINSLFWENIFIKEICIHCHSHSISLYSHIHTIAGASVKMKVVLVFLKSERKIAGLWAQVCTRFFLCIAYGCFTLCF